MRQRIKGCPAHPAFSFCLVYMVTRQYHPPSSFSGKPIMYKGGSKSMVLLTPVVPRASPMSKRIHATSAQVHFPCTSGFIGADIPVITTFSEKFGWTCATLLPI